MLKSVYTGLLMVLFSGLASAAPGDTTWVQAQNNIQLNAYGAFDAAVSFPATTTTYRKIYMVFTLGEYACAPTDQYCHQWDYDVHNILMTPAGDTLELSRFITPYGNTGVPHFNLSWTYRYIYDVTDYAPLLKNNAALRIFYSGYSWGYSANVKFAFIEGTPERTVLRVDKFWKGSYAYGNASNPIDNNVTAVTKTAPTGTQAAELKFTVTGHGADANGCCEFASHNYQVKVNGSVTDTKAIWRTDCGSNEIYPQGGTWIYERGNWCPGALTYTNSHILPGITGGTSFNADVDFDPYTVSSNYGSYNVTGNVIYYAGYNKTKDASIEDIIAPSNFEGHFRENPSDGKPIISIRNSGSTPITAMQIKYWVKDSAASTYNWTGSLAPLAVTQITLPELAAIKNMSINAASGTYQFNSQILTVNGSADNDATDDTLRSYFSVAPLWPNTFVVYMKTNSEGVTNVGQNPSETSWQITDVNNNVVASRTNANVSTTYFDTVSLPQTGFYKLTVNDAGCDGLHWWVWDQTPSSGVTAGNFAIRDYITGATFPLHGNTYSGTYHDDFGCGFVQSFSTIGYPAGVQPVNVAAPTLLAYPSPANNILHVDLHGAGTVNGTVQICDAIGQVVLRQEVHSASNQLSVSALSSGIYHISYISNTGLRITNRITIAK